MTRPFLSIRRLERRLVTGGIEALDFKPGVNLLTGRPNTGKTKWLKTLDYLLGDPGENPFEGTEEDGLAEKYDLASVVLKIGDEQLKISRKWREPGSKTKIFVGDHGMTTSEFQKFLMNKLLIPLLNFPKGNPMSGQTWPELSFRILLRHIHRQQRFWSDIADLQPEGEQHASLLQFLGLAEKVFTEEYGKLIQLKMDADRLKARRDQYQQTLDDLARDIISEPGFVIGANPTTVRMAGERIARETEALRGLRLKVIEGARNDAIAPEYHSRILLLGEEREKIIETLEDLRGKAGSTGDRLNKIRRYRSDLGDEIERISRAVDAGSVLADLKITHCPACDQAVNDSGIEHNHCFLCHQHLPEELAAVELATVRIKFEQDRMGGEVKEAEELLEFLHRDSKRISVSMKLAEERLKMLENELAPARKAIAALVQEQVSGIDMQLGEMSERQRQVGRVSGAIGEGQLISDRILKIEKEIQPLQEHVMEVARATDFDAAAAQLEDGMNSYLERINQLRPGVWRHSQIKVDISRSKLTIRVGSKRWNVALGGTDSLYFLMSYHYGLLTLSNKSNHHYPGVSIIDVPGEFSGEAVEDKENFIVQPFIELLSQDEYSEAQFIITGASFAGLDDVNRLNQTTVYVS